jgi:hypothetical protein
LQLTTRLAAGDKSGKTKPEARGRTRHLDSGRSRFQGFLVITAEFVAGKESTRMANATVDFVVVG